MRALLFSLTIVVSPSPSVQHGPAVIQPNVPAITKAVSVPALERVAVLGASVSDGFGLDQELGVRTVLADVIEATLKTGYDPVLSKASGFFFMDPVKSSREEVEAAQAKNATLIVGLDYLFWFGYGRVAAEQDRPARFEKGLALLETLFDRFVQGAGENLRGHGLGLSIAQGIAELHGGRIAVRNLSEGGCEFAVRLPRIRGSSPSA